MNTGLLVLIILAGVAVAAVMYQPTGYLGQWQKLARSFETDRRPLQAKFRNVAIQFGGGLSEFAQFDVEIDDDGLWLMHDGPEPRKAPANMLIPWSKIRHVKAKRKWQYFDVMADKPIPMGTDHELGAALMRRLGGS